MFQGRPHLILFLVAFVVLIGTVVQPTFAWQVGLPYGHSNRFGGEADSGWHRGQIEFAGSERRVRAGDDYVRWTQSQINWWRANGNSHNRPAMVFHAFVLDSNTCGDIRIVNAGWSWANFPGWRPEHIYTKKAGCWRGRNNEIRFLIYQYNQLVANQPYYFQHLFRDMKYNGSQRGKGKITVDTYHDRWPWHDGVQKDYHTVFCVMDNSDTATTCW
jgi:hypothetical protein